MCGIIGYIGEKEAIPILINGLKKLEYRGYDSAGLTIQNNSQLSTIKKQGKIKELEKNLKDSKSKIGIAHTRWATHGKPNEINAHPHINQNNSISIVHNGIIENHNALKELLEKEGVKFSSNTDSEILAHLISKFYKDDLEEATIKALELVEGTYGLAVINKDKEEIIVARKGSPLIIGLGEHENFVASDVPAILEHTKRVIYLDDNEIAKIKKDSYKVKHINGNYVDKEIHEIKWSLDKIEKKGFKHFMLKEIYEQPLSIKNALRGRLTDNIKLNLNFDINEIQRIILLACGTSWHSALIGKHLIEKLTNIPVEVDYASEFRYRNPVISEKDLTIVISQSGETADTLAALKKAKSKKSKTLGLINVVGSTIAREVDSGIYLHAGPEIGVASTKAFTSQVLSLALLSLQLAKGKNLPIRQDLMDEIKILPNKISEFLKEDTKIREIAKEFKDSKNFLYLGRGINFPVALEGALKLKEISYIHAEGYPAAEMKHGPIALIDENMPVVFIATKSDLSPKILSNMQEVKSRNGKIIAIKNDNDYEIKKLADYTIKVPDTLEELSPIMNVLPLQLLAYHIADLKGIDVDKPRNLAKSVTVE
ncbi:glutamine--fructose-6-phosphate transaminase (isomerizing) [Candidatus Woesearchaeota archaeon]|jgi:glutamine---fructose-6-phosphate transaminase (isomerizing)|nr:glutamine--fructose-6-phosphate transaminase (isomerizing) [Candidatus Woesearchaeota archaeon]MBT4321923.1 glutamine--fructose-6-phosphate transaminase (isomerizing) [Candidatus Woesearchaeota archaeon]MBT4630618.1 glutamine--fructose-6-phosphate transaminase (isomerizing) [Candidatus Woesearchaeota archaeon]